MKSLVKRAGVIIGLIALAQSSLYAQKIQLSNALVISTPKTASESEVKAYVARAQESKGTLHVLRADRGQGKGNHVLVWTNKTNENLAPLALTEYRLIGADKAGRLPAIDILGVHYVKVQPEKQKEFETFVSDKVHPSIASMLPDMRLLYYKGVSGENTGSYILVFAIDSYAAREKYWPTDASETQILKDAFKPHQALAKELSSYLVDGSYVDASSGFAAAYFESKKWTDFIRVGALRN